jgi:hypothetical protein
MGKMASSIGTIGGALIGASMGNPALGAQIGGAAGSLLGGSPNVSGAYGGASAQQLAAAQQAANMAQFRPVGITTRFGSSNFQIDPNTGQLVSAGYTVAPELQAIQNRLLTQAGAYDPTQVAQQTAMLTPAAQSLFNMGQGYLSESPEAARQRYISQQQALLAPQQEQALAGIRNRLFQTGRTGLATGGTTQGMAQTNPELAAYYNALAQQQNQLAAGAEQAAQQQAQFGAGLFGTGSSLLAQVPALTSAAYSPLQTQLGLAGSIENLGQQGLELGSALGGRAATTGATAGRLLQLGTETSAQTGLAGQIAQQGIESTRNRTLTNQLTSLSQNPQIQNWFSNILSPKPYGDRGTLFSNTPGNYTEFDY